MGDPSLGSFARVSSHKQNHEGVSKSPKRTISCYDGVEPGLWWGPGPGCDNLVSEPIPGRKCADEDVGPLRGWIVRSHIAQGSGSCKPYMYIPISTKHEAFWELTGFGFGRNSEVKRVQGQSIPRMGEPLRSSTRVSSHKQNREGVVEAQSRQYCATAESSRGCGGGSATDRVYNVGDWVFLKLSSWKCPVRFGK